LVHLLCKAPEALREVGFQLLAQEFETVADHPTPLEFCALHLSAVVVPVALDFPCELHEKEVGAVQQTEEDV
jgi:hypothetical protein